jgi:hypothetical protein
MCVSIFIYIWQRFGGMAVDKREIFIYVYIHIYIYICIYIYIYMCENGCGWKGVHIYIYVCIYIYSIAVDER